MIKELTPNHALDIPWIVYPYKGPSSKSTMVVACRYSEGTGFSTDKDAFGEFVGPIPLFEFKVVKAKNDF